MFCFKCGASMADESSTCAQCGAAASEAPQITPRAQPPAPPAPTYLGGGTMPQAYSLPQPTEGKATTSMILGILSLTCLGALAGIPAVILGHIAKANIRKSGGRLGGDGMATAGLVTGYISVALLPFILAIIIPNLLHSRIAANESAAAGTVRNINTAQVSYSIDYHAGFARDLATLGPEPSGECGGNGSQQHACLLDATLGCTRSWCQQSGYQFRVTATCGEDGVCRDYVVVAVPLRAGSTGNRSFCSTADAVLRTKSGGSVWEPPTATECQSWAAA